MDGSKENNKTNGDYLVPCDWYPIAIHNGYFGVRLPIDYYNFAGIHTKEECCLYQFC